MNLNRAKSTILGLIKKQLFFEYKGSRNQVEVFSGRIVKCYSSIFIVELDNKTIKSFSYNDFIIGNLKIIS